MSPDQESTVAEEVGTVSLQLPKSCIEWLDLASVRWKHKTGAHHPSKSAVVERLLRKAMGEGEE